MSTLIVRDACLLVNGDPETRGEPSQHLRDRLSAAASIDRNTVAACLDVLATSIGGEESDDEVLEASMLLGLTHAKAAQEAAVNPVASGRRLAARREREGEVGFARAVLEILAESQPSNRSVERALASLMRRQGMVEELVDRYLGKAQRLLDEGHSQEAIPWLREVLLLDRSRKDVARMIRDLRFDEIGQHKSKKRRVRVAIVTLVLFFLTSLLVLRELEVHGEWGDLPQGVEDDLASMRARLTAVEAFLEDHPIWHGSLMAVSERGELRVEIDRINTAIVAQRERMAEGRRRKEHLANGARDKGLLYAERRDFQGALEQFQQALDTAADDWHHREQVEIDVAAILEYVADSGEGGGQ